VESETGGAVGNRKSNSFLKLRYVGMADQHSTNCWAWKCVNNPEEQHTMIGTNSSDAINLIWAG